MDSKPKPENVRSMLAAAVAAVSSTANTEAAPRPGEVPNGNSDPAVAAAAASSMLFGSPSSLVSSPLFALGPDGKLIPLFNAATVWQAAQQQQEGRRKPLADRSPDAPFSAEEQRLLLQFLLSQQLLSPNSWGSDGQTPTTVVSFRDFAVRFCGFVVSNFPKTFV